MVLASLHSYVGCGLWRLSVTRQTIDIFHSYTPNSWHACTLNPESSLLLLLSTLLPLCLFSQHLLLSGNKFSPRRGNALRRPRQQVFRTIHYQTKCRRSALVLSDLPRHPSGTLVKQNVRQSACPQTQTQVLVLGELNLGKADGAGYHQLSRVWIVLAVHRPAADHC